MELLTKKLYLQHLVADKNRWNRPLTNGEKKLGFLGWHARGYLPHCDYPGLVQLVTFQLADSMPTSRRGEWEHLLSIAEVQKRRLELERYLDRGMGGCDLRIKQIASLAEGALLHFHNRDYELMAWCVMPNHIHVLVDVWQSPLWKLVRSWKRFVATGADLILERRSPTRRDDGVPGRRPALRRQRLQWQREYWDTYMRDTGQEQKAIRYIETNPVKAKLCQSPQNWQFSSARFRNSETNSLSLG